MPVIHLDHVDAEVSRKQLLEAIKTMPPEERRVFLEEAGSLQASEGPTRLSAKESELLERINAGPSQEEWAKFHELRERRRDETITEKEQAELLHLVDVIEQFQAARVEALVALSQLRGIPLPELMQSLGIKSPGYV